MTTVICFFGFCYLKHIGFDIHVEIFEKKVKTLAIIIILLIPVLYGKTRLKND